MWFSLSLLLLIIAETALHTWMFDNFSAHSSFLVRSSFLDPLSFVTVDHVIFVTSVRVTWVFWSLSLMSVCTFFTRKSLRNDRESQTLFPTVLDPARRTRFLCCRDQGFRDGESVPLIGVWGTTQLYYSVESLCTLGSGDVVYCAYER